MDTKSEKLNQQLLKFNLETSFGDNDFYVSKSNKHILDLFDQWPNWKKKFFEYKW